jgi:hypothetical protein
MALAKKMWNKSYKSYTEEKLEIHKQKSLKLPPQYPPVTWHLIFKWGMGDRGWANKTEGETNGGLFHCDLENTKIVLSFQRN